MYPANLYRLVLRVCGFSNDYLGNRRIILGENPYPRRSVLALTLINLQEIYRFVFDVKPSRLQMQETKSLRYSEVGRKALILGNGPSINRLNRTNVKTDNPDIWVVNNFYRLEWARELDVTHYVLTDPAHILLDSNGKNEQLEDILDFVREKSANLILPHWAFEITILKKKLIGIQTNYLDDRQLSAWSSNTSPVKPRGYLTLTLYKALGFAIYLGYEEISILGMDNTLFKTHVSDAQNRVRQFGDYAYEDDGRVWDYTDTFLDGMAGAFTMYSHLFGDLSKFKGPIQNLDPQSLTTAFPKTSTHRWVNLHVKKNNQEGSEVDDGD
jgi:hypothetical protein